MADNKNILAEDVKLVDYDGLSIFWSAAKSYIEGADATNLGKIEENTAAISKNVEDIAKLNAVTIASEAECREIVEGKSNE